MLRIKEIAKEKGLTIDDLSKKLEVNRVTLSRTINGNPTINTLKQIASALNVDVRDLFDNTSDTTSIDLFYKSPDGEMKKFGKFIPNGNVKLE